MKLYDESIKTLLGNFDFSQAKSLDIVNTNWEDVGDHNLILRADMAYELGGGTNPAVSAMAVTCNDEFVNADEVLLLGPDLKDIKPWPDDIETLQEMKDRAMRFLDFIREQYPDSQVLAVGHGIINKAIQAVYWNKEMHEVEKMKNAEVRILDI